MHRHTRLSVLPLALAIALTGCSSTSGDSADGTAQASTARPAGCERNRCDLEYDACKASETNRCAECNAECGTMSYEFVVQCLDVCNDICSRPSTSTCSSTYDSCVKSPRNAVCTDGMDPNDVPTSPDWFWTFTSPAEAHQGACTADELKQFETDCLGESSSASACEAFVEAHRGCNECIVTDPAAPVWGPIVVDSSGDAWINSEGCIAHVAGDESCAKMVYEANACLSGCNQASDREACLEFARAHDCKPKLAAAESCAATLGVATSPEYAPCGGAVAEATPEIVMSIIGFFCGSP